MSALLRNRGIPPLIKGGLIFAAGLALFTLLLYVAGPDFGDRTLFLLLAVLRCLSILICLFSLAAMGFTIRNLIVRFRAACFASLAVYVCAFLVGAVLFAANAFIIAAAGGNG